VARVIAATSFDPIRHGTPIGAIFILLPFAFVMCDEWLAVLLGGRSQPVFAVTASGVFVVRVTSATAGR
jgi:hypothetical protein